MKRTSRLIVLMSLLVVTAAVAILMQFLTPVPESGGIGVADRTHPKVVDHWMNHMRAWYYPGPHSEQFEEGFIRDFFHDQRGGVFLDVGAAHYERGSNTYFLEKTLGWSGIAIDALTDYEAGYVEHRPKTRFLGVFVSDRSDETVEFFRLVGDENKSSSNKTFMDEMVKLTHRTPEHRVVPTVTLNHLLDKLGVKDIDLLSMDIETAEPAALRGFDIDKYHPKLAVVETLDPVKSEIYDYFTHHGYKNIEIYSTHDVRNAYFAPTNLAEEAEHRAPPWD